jgi:hypothetical protein
MLRVSAGVLTFGLVFGGKRRQAIIVRGWMLAGLGKGGPLPLSEVRRTIQGNMARYTDGKPVVTAPVEVLDYIRSHFGPVEMLDNGLCQIVSLVPTGNHFEAIILTSPLAGRDYDMLPHQRSDSQDQTVGHGDGFIFLVDKV